MADLFAGISVSDLAAAQEWYEKLLGSPPDMHPNDIEAVWQLGTGQWVYIQVRPEHAGHSLTTLMIDDLDGWISAVAGRGLEPAEDETYDNGVRKVTYRDPEGNELGVGATP